MTIAARLASVRERIAAACRNVGRDPDEVELLAVSKTRLATDVVCAHAAGQCAFGENKVQELCAKSAELVDLPLAWHMIGSVQTNKIRPMVLAPGLALLHSVDRMRLAHRLQAVLAEEDLELECLLQVSATREPQKSGVSPEDAEVLLATVRDECPRLRVRGLMAMGPLVGDPAPVFAAVAKLRERLRATSGLALETLSLGMTGDLEAAIAAGSTLVRVGTAIFGPRV